MDTLQLNLARKWRSRSFDQIVDQELPVRMLKNSLYLDHFFPVYLFSGQRGCGKTTTARVFAAAVNCDQISFFQKNPKKQAVPCLNCSSCSAMLSGNHPDFIEIDAASHTGVENVRQIIDSASLLPLMGRKKVYLIDEAHMLSKAAFNAFLKILEEPPRSVLFILATTDSQKILETVRSRCFQLFFKPIGVIPLLKHLTHVCKKENIKGEKQALELIIAASEGSARDALNLLEQVRFSTGGVTKDAVLSILGHLDDVHLIKIFEIIVHKGPIELLEFCKKINLELFSADFIRGRLIEMTRSSLWIKYGVTQSDNVERDTVLQGIVAGCSVERLYAILQSFYSYENIWLKTTSKYELLEMILLQVCQKKDGNDNSGLPSSVSAPLVEDIELVDEDDDELEEEEEGEIEDGDFAAMWNRFVLQVDSLNDPVVSSIFKQGMPVAFDEKSAKLDVVFPAKLLFFQELLSGTEALWLPLLQKLFLKPVVLNMLFDEKKDIKKAPSVMKKTVRSEPVVQVNTQRQKTDRSSRPAGQSLRRAASTVVHSGRRGTVLDVSDVEKWKTANMLLQYFPGTIREVSKELQ